MISLADKYDALRTEYLTKFCKKQGLNIENVEFTEPWILIGDYCFSYYDIRIDIDNNMPKKKILEWHYLALEAGLANEKITNYSNFCKYGWITE